MVSLMGEKLSSLYDAHQVTAVKLSEVRSMRLDGLAISMRHDHATYLAVLRLSPPPQMAPLLYSPGPLAGMFK